MSDHATECSRALTGCPVPSTASPKPALGPARARASHACRGGGPQNSSPPSDDPAIPATAGGTATGADPDPDPRPSADPADAAARSPDFLRDTLRSDSGGLLCAFGLALALPRGSSASLAGSGRPTDPGVLGSPGTTRSVLELVEAAAAAAAAAAALDLRALLRERFVLVLALLVPGGKAAAEGVGLGGGEKSGRELV